MHRPVRRAALLALALAFAAPAGAALASTPASDTLAVPGDSGQTSSVTFTGTIPGGSKQTSTCAAGPGTDSHATTITLPALGYAAVTAKVVFTISWSAAGPGAANDEVLTVLGPDGKAAGSSDATNAGSPSETVALTNPSAGTYTLLSCSYLAPTAQTYTGTVTVTTTAPTGPKPAAVVVNDKTNTFTAATVVDPVLYGGEPGFNFDNSPGGVSADRSFVDWPVSSRQNIGVLFRSEDGGLSYLKRYADDGDAAQGGTACDGRQVPTCAGGGGGDTDVFVDPGNGRVLFSSQEALAGELVGTSADNGDTFPVARQDAFVNKGATGVDRQWQASYAGTDTVFLAYHVPLAGEFINRNDAGGAAGQWSVPGVPQIPLVTQSGAMIIDQNHRVNGGKDRPIYIAYLNSGFKLGVSLDGASTFVVKSVPSGTSVRNFTKLNVDKAGNLYATWVDSGTQQTYLATSLYADPANDPAQGGVPGSKWDTPVQVSAAPVTVSIFSDLVAGDPGRVAINYYGTAAPATTPDTVKPGQGGWFPYLATSTNALCQWDATPCTGPTFHQGVISHKANHDDNICTSGTTCAATGGNRNLLDYMDISLDTEGHLGFVWGDTINGNGLPYVKVARQLSGPSLYTDKPAASGTDRANGVADASGDALWPTAGARVRSATNSPALDVQATTVTLKDNATLEVRLGLADATALGTAVPGGGTATENGVPLQQAKYVTRFDLGGNVYYVGANVPAGASSPTFFSGAVGAGEAVLAAGGGTTAYGNSYKPLGPASGRVEGNTLIIDVPVSALGAAKAGDRVYSVGSYSLIGPADDAVLLNTVPFTVDATPTFDTVLGANDGPAAVVPEVPLATLLPLTAAGVLAAVVSLRRRRAHPTRA